MLNANKTKYYYEDEHLYFWFGDHHSSEYKLFIVSKNDLQIENTTGASTEYSNAMFQEGSYLLGTQRKQKTFKRQVAAEGLTMDEYRSMLTWLSEGATGMLFFDSNPYWGWSVVLETVGDANVCYTSNGLIIEMELTWKTIGNYLAKNRYNSMGLDLVPVANTTYDITSGNQYGLPSYFYANAETNLEQELNNNGYAIYNIVNIGNAFQYIDSVNTLYQNTTNNTKFDVALIKDGKKISFATVEFNNLQNSDIIVQYFGASNFIFVDGVLAEEHNKFLYSSQTQGLLKMSGVLPILIDNFNNSIATSLKYKGYTHIVEVNTTSLHDVWDREWVAESASSISGLATSRIKIFNFNEFSNYQRNGDYKYYAIATHKIAILGVERDTKYGTLTVHSYNNL